MGLVGFYKCFIQNFSDIAAPLSDLIHIRKAAKILRLREYEEAFEKLKTALMTGSVLRVSDFQREFIAFTDTSNTGLGAVLSQADDNGDLHPVTFQSKKLQAGERQLSTIEHECLAIVWLLQKLRPYIWERHFVLCTDHSPLLWLRTIRANNKLMRWAVLLQDFDFEMRSVKGGRCLVKKTGRMTDGNDEICNF